MRLHRYPCDGYVGLWITEEECQQKQETQHKISVNAYHDLCFSKRDL